ncbi:hypothetical protein SAMN05216323_106414 [Williamwhitmania taraxaci]|uniref:Uncharacterized protein n=1 Tax=Williamwhitmania taraxaci TaxID=1640674 RepID=A0A1G6QPP1_9BACT|nr:hypothetical protein SAMN05216323_106414 [Williamwhitmania taraxaci]
MRKSYIIPTFGGDEEEVINCKEKYGEMEQ